MPEKKIAAGEIIYKEGDVPDFAYIVNSGTVELFFLDGITEVKTSTIEAGKTFGELAAFKPNELRSINARAVTPCVLQAMDANEFQMHFAKCPAAIQPFLTVAIEKIVPAKTRSKITTNGVSKSDVEKITITPVTDTLKTQFKAMEVPIAALPFRIGGYPEEQEKNRRDQLHLAIASARNPLAISRQHCEIMVDDGDKIILRDMGSRFGTKVNGQLIGRGRGIYSAVLKKGTNEVYLGTGDQYKLTINCK